MNLMKELPRIAARVLKNTRGVYPELKSRLGLVAEAYGTAAVAKDFEQWCGNLAETPRYPISEYLKVVDSRLGNAEEFIALDLKNPAVPELASLTYELTGVLPSSISVAELLNLYSVDEVRAALTEFAEGLTERELKTSMRTFFANGGTGASAVIMARRRRAKPILIPKQVSADMCDCTEATTHLDPLHLWTACSKGKSNAH